MLNHPLIALCTLAAFLWLCNQHAETSYPNAQISKLSELQDHYIKFRVGKYADIHSHHMTQNERRVAMNELYGE